MKYKIGIAHLYTEASIKKDRPQGIYDLVSDDKGGFALYRDEMGIPWWFLKISMKEVDDDTA